MHRPRCKKSWREDIRLSDHNLINSYRYCLECEYYLYAYAQLCIRHIHSRDLSDSNHMIYGPFYRQPLKSLKQQQDRPQI